MLGDSTISAVIAVSDLNAGKEFYGNTLGLGAGDENPAGVYYSSGSGKLLIYESPNAGTSKATVVGWTVSDVEGTVDALKAKGVVFEQYDMPGVTREGDIHFMGPTKAVWFKDPDGNILSLSDM
jgi:catechol 2,3-dioxygenase-like lactoylglutathione lyase family enzyme